MRILGIAGGFGHDASAALFLDGKLAAVVEEERVRRRKFAFNDPAELAALACTRMAGIQLSDIDVVGLSWKSELDPTNDRMSRADEQLRSSSLLAPLRRHARWLTYNHHECHALAAYSFAGMQEPSVVLVMDGRGEQCSTSVHVVSASGIETLALSPLTASLGTFYAAATDYCGFGYGGQGKVMGLAAYGRPIVDFAELGLNDLRFDLDRELPGLFLNRTLEHRHVFATWKDRFEEAFGSARNPKTELDGMSLSIDADNRFRQHHADAAASVQATLERLVTSLMDRLVARFPKFPILIAGGVALNCTMNGALRQRYKETEIHFLTVPHDAGTSIGAAVLAARDLNEPIQHGFDPYLGIGWTDDEIAQVLTSVGARYKTPSDLPQTVASLILDGQTIGWFQGRAEVGPRALGHRSILANPFDLSLKGHLNTSVKNRESWRPFGPSVRDEDMKRLYGVDSAPYMIEAFKIAPQYANELKSVTHIDGTSRPHSTKSGQVHARYTALLDALGSNMGVGVVLNTSFNVGHEPIVYSPIDALRTYYASSIDALAIGPFLLEKAQ
jgi:carbamoyltransferase